MNIRHYLTMIAVALTVQANANNYLGMEPLTLEVPEMKAALADMSETSTIHLDMTTPSALHDESDDNRRQVET